MPPSQLPLIDCPQHFQLLALAEGTLTDQDSRVLEEHVAVCEACDAKLASIEEHSDTLVRALATMPATEDDEATFRMLQAELLARPESFQGNSHSTPTEAFSRQVPLELVLPLQLGNYELLEQIGSGAHGAVFRARHKRLERDVAIKLLLHAGGPAVDDFLNEMRIVGQLDHPNIIRATDAGEDGGIYFLVMEFVAGIDVSSLLRRIGRLSVADACEIARQSALGLHMAHHHGLVHRDVKTSNLLFTVRGQVKLLDLGLATIASPAMAQEPSAKSGPRGTADYMPPEQWLEASGVTAGADIYSLGCTLFKLLTGDPPFRVLPEGVTSKQQAHEVAAIPALADFRDDVPAALEQLLQRMLAKSPSERPASAMDVATRLARYARGSNLPSIAAKVFPDAAVTCASTAPRKRSVSRRVVLVGAAVAGVALLQLFWPKSRAARIQSGHWRPLSPADPPLLNLTSRGESDLDVEQGRLVLSSQDPVLLNLGSPIGGQYRWRTTLRRAEWASSAGLFFRLRKEAGGEGHVSFHAIELRATSAGKSLLLWTYYHKTNQGLGEPSVLAEASCPIELDNNTACQLEVVLGRSGFPEVSLNERVIPKSQWVVSKEGRELIVTNVDQLPATYAGRIGIFHHRGRTTSLTSQIMYLEG